MQHTKSQGDTIRIVYHGHELVIDLGLHSLSALRNISEHVRIRTGEQWNDLVDDTEYPEMRSLIITDVEFDYISTEETVDIITVLTLLARDPLTALTIYNETPAVFFVAIDRFMIDLASVCPDIYATSPMGFSDIWNIINPNQYPRKAFARMLWTAVVNFCISRGPRILGRAYYEWKIVSSADVVPTERIKNLVAQNYLSPSSIPITSQFSTLVLSPERRKELGKIIVEVSDSALLCPASNLKQICDRMNEMISDIYTTDGCPAPAGWLGISGSAVLWHVMGCPGTWTPHDIDVFVALDESGNSVPIDWNLFNDAFFTGFLPIVHANERGRNYQFIGTPATTPMELCERVIHSFDLPCCQLMWIDNKLYATIEALHAIQTRKMHPLRYNESRIDKYRARGFDVLVSPKGSYELETGPSRTHVPSCQIINDGQIADQAPKETWIVDHSYYVQVLERMKKPGSQKNVPKDILQYTRTVTGFVTRMTRGVRYKPLLPAAGSSIETSEGSEIPADTTFDVVDPLESPEDPTLAHRSKRRKIK